MRIVEHIPKSGVYKGVENYEIKSVLPDNVKNNLVLKDQKGNIIYTYKITDFLMTMYSMNPALDQVMGGIYEFFDFCSKVRLIRIPESVYNCDDEVTYSKFYKYVFKYLPKPVAVTALADFAKTTLANAVETDNPLVRICNPNLTSQGFIILSYFQIIYLYTHGNQKQNNIWQCLLFDVNNSQLDRYFFPPGL